VNCLGEYRTEKVLAFVAKQYEAFEQLNSRIGQMALDPFTPVGHRVVTLTLLRDVMDACLDPTMSIKSRLCQIEILKATVDRNLDVSAKGQKKRKR